MDCKANVNKEELAYIVLMVSVKQDLHSEKAKHNKLHLQV